MFTERVWQTGRRDRRLAGRRMVLVDVENVVGGPVLTVEEARAARFAVEEAIGLRHGDQVVVGSAPGGLLNTGLGWPGARRVMRRGIDGADQVILDVIINEAVGDRFDEVVLVSGDGIFTDAVAMLEGMGVRVTVVSRQGCCARRLRMAASRTVIIAERVDGLGGAA